MKTRAEARSNAYGESSNIGRLRWVSHTIPFENHTLKYDLILCEKSYFESMILAKYENHTLKYDFLEIHNLEIRVSKMVGIALWTSNSRTLVIFRWYTCVFNVN